MLYVSLVSSAVATSRGGRNTKHCIKNSLSQNAFNVPRCAEFFEAPTMRYDKTDCVLSVTPSMHLLRDIIFCKRTYENSLATHCTRRRISHFANDTYLHARERDLLSSTYVIMFSSYGIVFLSVSHQHSTSTYQGSTVRGSHYSFLEK